MRLQCSKTSVNPSVFIKMRGQNGNMCNLKSWICVDAIPFLSSSSCYWQNRERNVRRWVLLFFSVGSNRKSTYFICMVMWHDLVNANVLYLISVNRLYIRSSWYFFILSGNTVTHQLTSTKTSIQAINNTHTQTLTYIYIYH